MKIIPNAWHCWKWFTICIKNVHSFQTISIINNIFECFLEDVEVVGFPELSCEQLRDIVATYVERYKEMLEVRLLVISATDKLINEILNAVIRGQNLMTLNSDFQPAIISNMAKQEIQVNNYIGAM